MSERDHVMPSGPWQFDKQVTDGMLIIWKGVTLPEIKAFDKVKPRLGEDYKTWKKRLRDS